MVKSSDWSLLVCFNCFLFYLVLLALYNGGRKQKLIVWCAIQIKTINETETGKPFMWKCLYCSYWLIYLVNHFWVLNYLCQGNFFLACSFDSSPSPRICLTEEGNFSQHWCLLNYGNKRGRLTNSDDRLLGNNFLQEPSSWQFVDV